MSTPEDFHANEVFYFNVHRPLDLVRSLENRYADFPVGKIGGIFQEVLGLEVKNMKPDGNLGTGHVIYFVETERGTHVFRANHGVESPEHYMSLETQFIQLYRQAGIPVGTLLHADCSRSRYDFDFQILEVLPGKDLETEWTGTEQDYARICVELGRLVARQYKCPVEGFGRFGNSEKLRGNYATMYEYLTSYLDFDLAVLLEHRTIDLRMADRIRKVFSDNRHVFDVEKQGYMVHYDVADHNLRYEGDRVLALFDWENAVAFDPIMDLASAHTWVSHFGFKREKMLEGFLSELGHEPENLNLKMSIYFLRTMLWKVCFALRRGKFKERHKQLFEQALEETNYGRPLSNELP